jgi:hypothetical protein
MDFISASVIDKTSELTHQSMIEAVVIFVVRPVDQIEVASQQLRPQSQQPEFLEF